MASIEAEFEEKVPSGDDRKRWVCRHCDFIDYKNPKIVAGAIVRDRDERILFCRRAINPRKGYWTAPAGFLEAHEAPEEGAEREVYEEAGATIEIDGLVGIYTVRHVNQVHFFYSANLVGAIDQDAIGFETQEIAFYSREEIPWNDLSFPSVEWAIRQYLQANGRPQPLPRTGVFDKPHP